MSRRTPSLARRVFPAIALSTVGIGMVHSLDRPDVAGALGPIVPSTDPTATVTIAPVTSVPAGSAAPVVTAAPVGTSAPVVTAAPVGTSAPVVTAAPVGTSAPVVTAAPAANDCGAMTGTGAAKTITWRRDYGVLQVSASFTSSGAVCKATASVQTYDSRSQRYEDWAVPVLNQQASSAGNANIQGVSGATAVSDAYKSSLQSAIDNRK